MFVQFWDPSSSRVSCILDRGANNSVYILLFDHAGEWFIQSISIGYYDKKQSARDKERVQTCTALDNNR